MIVLDFEQGSTEWHELRRVCVTGTDCSVIMGENPYKSTGLLWRQKILGEEQFENDAMRRGSLLEPVARNFLNFSFNVDYQPKTIIHDERWWQLASLDGLDEKSILEIKCPGVKVYKSCELGKIPRYWQWQIQHALCVSGMEHCTLVVWRDEDQYIVQSIRRDEDMISRLIEAEEKFYVDHLLARREPECLVKL